MTRAGAATGHLGLGPPGQPLYDNQLGHRLPSGGTAGASWPWAWPCGLFLLSPVTLFAWVAGQLLE